MRGSASAGFGRHDLRHRHERSAGSYAWAGLLNCHYWVDPVRKVTGAMFTQLLPYYDTRVVELYGAFEHGLYTGLTSA